MFSSYCQIPTCFYLTIANWDVCVGSKSLLFINIVTVEYVFENWFQEDKVMVNMVQTIASFNIVQWLSIFTQNWTRSRSGLKTHNY